MAPGAAAIAGSSSDSRAAYQSAHLAATKTKDYLLENDRTSLLYEEQMARAIMESYKTWLEDKQARDTLRSLLREIDESQGVKPPLPAIDDADL